MGKTYSVRGLSACALAACGIGMLATEASAVQIFAYDNLGPNNVPGSVGDRLIRFDSANPLGTVVNIGQSGVASLGMTGQDFAANNVLYSVTGFGTGFAGSSLYTVNTATGAATLVGPTGLLSTNGISDLSWNPVTGQMQAISNAGAGVAQLHTINLATGQATLVGPITGLPAGNLEIGMATNSAGVNFLHNIADDRMYQLAGLVATPMTATIGIDTNFSQGMTINWGGANEWFLGSISNTPVFASQVRLMNNATGGTTSVLATWPNNGTGGLPQYETGDLAIPIPEPASLGLMAVAGLALAARRRTAL